MQIVMWDLGMSAMLFSAAKVALDLLSEANLIFSKKLARKESNSEKSKCTPAKQAFLAK